MKREKLIELSGQMRDALVEVYLGLPTQNVNSTTALERRKLIELRGVPGVEFPCWRCTDAGIAYLSAHVQALRVSPHVLDIDRRKFHKLGFRHMVHPEYLQTHTMHTK